MNKIKNQFSVLRFKFFRLVFTFLLLSCISIYSQWTKTNTPNNRNISALAANGYMLLAGADTGSIFLSTNNGTTWTMPNYLFRIPNTFIVAFALGNSAIFASSDGGNVNGETGYVFRSTDNGMNWEGVPTGLPMTTSVGYTALTVTGASVFVGTSGGGIYTSLNNGTSWTQIMPGVTSHLTALAYCGTNLFAGYYTLSPGYDLFIDRFNGSWSNIRSGLPTGIYNAQISAFIASGTTIYAAINGSDSGGIFHSVNNGTNWTKDTAGLPKALRVNALAVNGSTVYAGSLKGLYYLINNGWALYNTGLPTNTTIKDLIICGPSLFANTNNGLWYCPLTRIVTTYQLTVKAGTGGKIVVPLSSTDTVNAGAITTITAAPNSGYSFAFWTVAGGTPTIANINIASTTVILTSGNADLQANFKVATNIAFENQTKIHEPKGNCSTSLFFDLMGRNIQMHSRTIHGVYIETNGTINQIRFKY